MPNYLPITPNPVNTIETPSDISQFPMIPSSSTSSTTGLPLPSLSFSIPTAPSSNTSENVHILTAAPQPIPRPRPKSKKPCDPRPPPAHIEPSQMSVFSVVEFPPSSSPVSCAAERVKMRARGAAPTQRSIIEISSGPEDDYAPIVAAKKKTKTKRVTNEADGDTIMPPPKKRKTAEVVVVVSSTKKQKRRVSSDSELDDSLVQPKLKSNPTPKPQFTSQEKVPSDWSDLDIPPPPPKRTTKKRTALTLDSDEGDSSDTMERPQSAVCARVFDFLILLRLIPLAGLRRDCGCSDWVIRKQQVQAQEAD